jgi:hypothetical protein
MSQLPPPLPPPPKNSSRKWVGIVIAIIIVTGGIVGYLIFSGTIKTGTTPSMIAVDGVKIGVTKAYFYVLSELDPWGRPFGREELWMEVRFENTKQYKATVYGYFDEFYVEDAQSKSYRVLDAYTFDLLPGEINNVTLRLLKSVQLAGSEPTYYDFPTSTIGLKLVYNDGLGHGCKVPFEILQASET